MNKGVTLDFRETKSAMHAWKITEIEIENLDEYNGILAVGGDGTLHEVINGILNRKDKKIVPIGFVPNGTGNDLVACFGIKTVEESLERILAGDVVKMDVNKVLIDCEDGSEITDENRNERIRYSMSSTGIGFIGKLTHKSIDYKPYVGKGSYIAAGVA